MIPLGFDPQSIIWQIYAKVAIKPILPPKKYFLPSSPFIPHFTILSNLPIFPIFPNLSNLSNLSNFPLRILSI